MIPVEAIERVIDYLETRIRDVNDISGLYVSEKVATSKIRAYEDAISELRKVLSEYAR